MDTNTTAPSAPPNSTPGDAAARTFAVPELLENILLHFESAITVTRCWFEDVKIWSDGYVKGPTLSLFQLQRVNRAFRDTIEGSSQLQRQMLTEAINEDFYAMAMLTEAIDEDFNAMGNLGNGLYSPIRWFMQDMLGAVDYDEDPSTDDLGLMCVNAREVNRDNGHYYGPCNFPTLLETHNEFLANGGGYRTASWRKIKLGPAGYEKEIEVSFPLYLANPYDDELVWVSWDFKAQDTLGDLFDKWSPMIKTVDRQSRRYKLLQGWREKEDKELYKLDVEELSALGAISEVC